MEERKSVFFPPLIKCSLKEFMIIAKKRRMGEEENKPYIPYSNKEAKECFLHVYSINTVCFLQQKPKQKSPFQVHKGLKVN